MIEPLFETHATSRDNELQLASGHHDAPLSDRGEQQAVVLERATAHDHSRLYTALTSNVLTARPRLPLPDETSQS